MSKKQINLQETPALPGYDQNWFKVQVNGNDVLLKLSGSAYSTITSLYKEDADKVLVLITNNSIEHSPDNKEVIITTDNTNFIDENTYKNLIQGIVRVSSTLFEFN